MTPRLDLDDITNILLENPTFTVWKKQKPKTGGVMGFCKYTNQEMIVVLKA